MTRWKLRTSRSIRSRGAVGVLSATVLLCASVAVAGATTTPRGIEIAASYNGISADGTRVFFTTTEQMAGDTDSVADVYERSGGATTRVSVGAINGNGAFAATFRGSSADGTRVFFTTAEPLVAGDTDTRIDLYERAGGVTTWLSPGQTTGNGPHDVVYKGRSSDGLRVFFQSSEQLTLGDSDPLVDVYQRAGASLTKISIGNGPHGAVFDGASSDGSRVWFHTAEQLSGGDTDSVTDIYERSGSTTTRISVGTTNGNLAIAPTFHGASATGTRVFFSTTEGLVSQDVDSSRDIYQRSSNITNRISQGTVNGNGAFHASFAGASTTGTRVFFFTDERLVSGDTDSVRDVYERVSTTSTNRVSTGAVNGNGNFTANFGGASSTGARVLVRSSERLTSDDTDSAQDIFQRASGVTTRVSVGQINGNLARSAEFSVMSPSGLRVKFSTLEKLVPGDTDLNMDIYLREGSTTTRMSTGNGPHDARYRGASSDFSRTFFVTAEQLNGIDTDSTDDVYMRVLGSGSSTLVSRP